LRAAGQRDIDDQVGLGADCGQAVCITEAIGANLVAVFSPGRARREAAAGAAELDAIDRDVIAGCDRVCARSMVVSTA